MLTDLSFLEIGQPWPPKCERERLKMYHTNRKLFEGEHAEVYAEDFKRIERVIGNFQDVISYPAVLNFQKIMSLKTADLLLGEKPEIKANRKEGNKVVPDEKAQLALDMIDERSGEYGLQNTAYEVAIDVSRYGDGLFYIRNDGDYGVIDVTQPGIWYKVVSPDNVKKVLFHVLAWTYEVQNRNEKRKYLKAQVHSEGYYEETIFELQGDEISKVSKAKETHTTGLSDFAIVQVPNVITSDRAYGYDDYTDIDSIVSELSVRIGQISRVLDKHAAPSVSGPQSSLELDPKTGEWRLKMGDYFPRNSKDDPEVAYIVWDAQMDAAFKHIERLINLLYTISELGGAIFGDLSSSTGQVPSGSALRRLMISPLAKVNRIRMRFDNALKKALTLCSQLGGEDIVDLSDTFVSITWRDGLPSDPLEESQIINNRVSGQQTMSTKRVLTQFDGLSDEDADEELTRIQDEDTASTPLALPGFAQTDNGTDNGTETQKLPGGAQE